MNREEIKGLLPHREPMLLVDELELGQDGTAHGKYRVRGDEFFLQGHFPGNPVVPGVILCEIMAQSCALLVGLHLFNLAINTLGAFVHCARLQYVEFYGKFYEAGGRTFRPLGYKTKHVQITEP